MSYEPPQYYNRPVECVNCLKLKCELAAINTDLASLDWTNATLLREIGRLRLLLADNGIADV